jgi:hypothetical protein
VVLGSDRQVEGRNEISKGRRLRASGTNSSCSVSTWPGKENSYAVCSRWPTIGAMSENQNIMNCHYSGHKPCFYLH